jgi:kynurenine formamidase
MLDAMAGTHLVPPAYALPPEGKQPQYAPEVRAWLEEYEGKYGKRGFSDRTTEKVPLDWTCGSARVIDVMKLQGTTNESTWPASPMITPEWIQAAEKVEGGLKQGDVVLFRTGYLDRYLNSTPDKAGQIGATMWSDAYKGKSEGWPALSADAVVYLQSKGIRCVATDAPNLGGVDEKSALMTYWALGSRDMVGIEYLVNLNQVPKNAYFLFAALKIADCHGGPGRAIVLY